MNKLINKEYVIKISKKLMNPNTKEERYDLYLVSSYIKENINLFTIDELFNVFKNYHLYKNNMSNALAEDMLLCSIKKNELFTKVMPIWFSKDKYRQELKDYLKIINDNNNQEQLFDFYKKAPYFVSDFYKKNEKQSESLINLMLINDSTNLIYLKEFNENKVLRIIKEKNIDLRSLVRLMKVRKVENEKLTNKIYSLVVAKWNVEKFSIDKVMDDIIMSSPDFLIYLKNNHKDFFEKILSEKRTYKVGDVNVLCNFTQFYLLTMRGKDDIRENIKKIFSDNKELVLKDINYNIKLYNKNANFIEFVLQYNETHLFMLFNLKDEILSQEEKDMILSDAIYKLADSRTYEEEEIVWAKSIAEDADIEMINKYLKNIDFDMTASAKKYFNVIKEKKKLELILPESKVIPNKKIKL